MHSKAMARTMMICTLPPERRWPSGEVPYEVPGVWAANDQLLASLQATVAQLNCALNGHVTIRNRRPGDRDYLVITATTKMPDPAARGVGREGGAQRLHCEMASLVDNPAPVKGSLVRELCRAAGIQGELTRYLD